MQAQDDGFPYTSDDPSLVPPEGKNAVVSLTPQQMDDLKATMRLLVGSAMLGKEAYIQRLRSLQAAQEAITPGTIATNEDEAFRDKLGYLLMGILFETPDVVQRGLVRMEKAGSKAYGLASKILSPVVNSWIFSPVKRRYDRAALRSGEVIDRLIFQGRMEDQNSRLMLQQKAIDDLANDLLEYVIMRTELMDIVQEEGIGVAGGMLDEFRDQSANVDALMSSKLRSAFRRRTPKQPVTPSGNLPEGS